MFLYSLYHHTWVLSFIGSWIQVVWFNSYILKFTNILLYRSFCMWTIWLRWFIVRLHIYLDDDYDCFRSLQRHRQGNSRWADDKEGSFITDSIRMVCFIGLDISASVWMEQVMCDKKNESATLIIKFVKLHSNRSF